MGKWTPAASQLTVAVHGLGWGSAPGQGGLRSAQTRGGSLKTRQRGAAASAKAAARPGAARHEAEELSCRPSRRRDGGVPRVGALGRATSRASALSAAAARSRGASVGALTLNLPHAFVAGRLHELAECLHSLHGYLELQEEFVKVVRPSAVVVFRPCVQGDAG